MRKSRRAVVLAATIFGLGPFIVGCAPDVSQVPPGTLQEIRGIGSVQAESSLHIHEDTIEVTNLFVIDVDGSSVEDAVDTAVDLLQARGWRSLGKHPDLVGMTSAKWDAYATVRAFDSEELVHYPDVLKALKVMSAETEHSVIVEVMANYGEL
ncbi:hypothetical protein SAMN05421874_105142 [Nonomuraea maritima]|uniref:Lipoprotein n=1 Tax=Nonomuraea maritima TaxID=683260 RepID=A0A1G8Z8V8_9ACTN|nr:hypothetical protein [Nonomuraea maritima]SDK10630.1 hypothetical protein SAMN05421874_105142 [Nonomuraea maritima]